MDIEQVPAALRERLGVEGTVGLLQVLDNSHRDGRADMIAACTDHFERRLVEEISGVRVQIAQVEASLRREMTEMGAAIERGRLDGMPVLRGCAPDLWRASRRAAPEMS